MVVSDGPLGGEALAQRMVDMRRAYRDMVHFHATLSGMADRQDSHGIQIFDRFLAEYMGAHLEPLLRGEWQATHPEVASLDASLRLAKAEILVQMRYPRGVQKIIDDLETRYRGRDDLLVDYPLGRQGTLGDGLEILRDRKWSG